MNGKTAFECGIMQKLSWTKGTLLLLSNGLVDTNQYELLGVRHHWDSQDDDCLLFQINFKENKKLSNQAFIRMVDSCRTFLGTSKIKNDLVVSVCSLSSYFIHLNSYNGFGFFWSTKYYHSSLMKLLENFSNHNDINLLDINVLMNLREQMGDISFRMGKIIMKNAFPIFVKIKCS